MTVNSPSDAQSPIADFNQSVAAELAKFKDPNGEYIGWYQRKSRSPRTLYRASSIFTTVGSLIIPILIILTTNIDLSKPTAFTLNDWLILVSIIIPFLVAVMNHLSVLFQWKESWSDYKNTQFQMEALVHQFEIQIKKSLSLQPQDKQDTSALYDELIKLVEKMDQLRFKETKRYFTKLNDQGNKH